MKANLDGTVQKMIVKDLTEPAGITVDHINSRIVWADYAGEKIRSSDLNGHDIKTLAPPLRDTNPWGVAAQDGGIYWGNFNTGSIQTCDDQGLEVETLYMGKSGIRYLVLRTDKTYANGQE